MRNHPVAGVQFGEEEDDVDSAKFVEKHGGLGGGKLDGSSADLDLKS